MTFMSDGQEHGRRRKTSAHLFTPPRIRELEELTEQFTAELLHSVAGQEPADIEPLTGLLPGWIITSLLGLPREDSRLLVEWGDAINLNLHRSTHIDEASAALQQVRRYVHDLAAAHRSGRQRTELLGTILDAASSGQDQRLVSMFIEMQIGGYETTRGLLGSGIVLLLRHRDQWERMVADPTLAPNATDELLRMVSPALWDGAHPAGRARARGRHDHAEGHHPGHARRGEP